MYIHTYVHNIRRDSHISIRTDFNLGSFNNVSSSKTPSYIFDVLKWNGECKEFLIEKYSS